MKKLIPYLAVTAILYLLYSFVPWQFNPSMWSRDTRAMFVFIWVGCMALTPIVIAMIESSKD